MQSYPLTPGSMKGRMLTSGPAFALSVVQGSQEAMLAAELSLWAPREQGQCLLCLIHCSFRSLAQCLPWPPYQGLALTCFSHHHFLQRSRHTWSRINCQVATSPPRVHVCAVGAGWVGAWPVWVLLSMFGGRAKVPSSPPLLLLGPWKVPGKKGRLGAAHTPPPALQKGNSFSKCRFELATPLL